ncbi:MAG: hypothetical protein IPP71_13315 [Bacteroidetes bacterium]|nr:hypothetical protein [Bacteroidota bacterium]
MKKSLLLVILVIYSLTTFSQGLENIIVEKYYISDANDATVNSSGGVLPIGSVTYRVYIDMLPDYIFQSAYGDPNHELRIETSTLFFNNEDRGAIHPTFNFSYCDDNTVMLDSWLSVGAACNGRFGIQKDQDDGVGTVVNSDGVLLNTDPLIGIPLTQQDGLIAGTPESVISVGIGTEIMVFDAQNDGTNGPLFSTLNGAWASVNGSVGPNPALNQVLLAQITTDGVFSFSLNVQIRNQTTLSVENYVAANPTGAEILFAGLNYNSTIGLGENTFDLALTLYPDPPKGFVTLEITTT